MSAHKARQVLSEFWDGSLPINPVKAAEHFGIEVRRTNDDDSCSGSAFMDDGQKVIEYKNSEFSLRQRFTVAHELGHHMLGHATNDRQFRDGAKEFNIHTHDPFEVQANKFAAELLMPKEMVDFLIEKKEITDLKQLAKKFDVSTMAMKFRLGNLGWI